MNVIFQTVLLIASSLLFSVSLAQEAVSVDGISYPKTVENELGKVTVHHPQLESWTEFETMQGRLVVEVQQAGGEKSWIGSFLIEGKTDVDFDERLVVLHDMKVLERQFPGGEPPEEVLEIGRQAVTLKPRTVPLDVVIRALPEDFELPSRGMAPPLKNDPPAIYVASSPTDMVVINGEPVLAPIEDTKLQFVVNTNWDLFYHTSKKRWYILNNFAWQVSKSLDEPKWKTTTRLPGDFKKLPDSENWERVKQRLPAKKPRKDPPSLIISQRPAELIQLSGEPRLELIQGTDVSFVNNTVSDLFVHGDSYYFLVSGRWFTSPQLADGWTAVEALPESFKYIPEDHEKSHVLASVPGSEEARAALVEALIPRKAQISTAAGSDIEVVYAGEPQFTAIEGTSLQRAVNTEFQVIKLGAKYYLCSNAVWFESGAPEGPWAVATLIPQEIYSIPPSDPYHNTTYVYIYDDDDDDEETVTYGYTSGYHDAFVTVSFIAFGTGWWYDPWVYYPPYGYPYYYWYPHSYGYGAWYNPATGYYGQRAVGYGPYGGVGSTAVYNPRTGTYGRGWAAWDSNELARSGYAFNPRRNTYVAGNSYYNFDSREGWRESYVQRGERWVYSEADIDGNRTRSQFETAKGLTGSSERIREGDAITGSGELAYRDRSATTESRIDRDGAELNMRGDRGGELDVSRERGEAGRDLSGTTADGRAFEGTTERTERGARTRLEGEDGGRAALNRQGGNVSGIGQSSSGDLYAGRNGNVYRRGDDGWQRYDNGNWSGMDRSSRDWSSRNRSDLNRQYSARRSGTRNYNQFRSQRGSLARGGRGRRR